MTPLTMLRRLFLLPPNEPLTHLVLALATVVLAGMLWAVLWQAELIEYQRVLIRDLCSSCFR